MQIMLFLKGLSSWTCVPFKNVFQLQFICIETGFLGNRIEMLHLKTADDGHLNSAFDIFKWHQTFDTHFELLQSHFAALMSSKLEPGVC